MLLSHKGFVLHDFAVDQPGMVVMSLYLGASVITRLDAGLSRGLVRDAEQIVASTTSGARVAMEQSWPLREARAVFSREESEAADLRARALDHARRVSRSESKPTALSSSARVHIVMARCKEKMEWLRDPPVESWTRVARVSALFLYDMCLEKLGKCCHDEECRSGDWPARLAAAAEAVQRPLSYMCDTYGIAVESCCIPALSPEMMESTAAGKRI
jgi:hypothetical protein